MSPVGIVIAAGGVLAALALLARSRDGYGAPAHRPPRPWTVTHAPLRTGALLALAGLAIAVMQLAAPWIVGELTDRIAGSDGPLPTLERRGPVATWLPPERPGPATGAP